MKTINALLAVGVIALSATQLSCSVNDYCLNCGTDDGGTGSGDGDANDAGDLIDAPVDAACVPSGDEVCDGEDNDCDGLVDNNPTDIGGLCTNQQGECAGGTTTCENGQIRCTKSPSPEVCDFKDNNCNGMVDEGDPGGGAKCGTDVGDCIAGVQRCDSFAGCNPNLNCTGPTCCIQCIGFVDTRNDPETCNGADDDCDGMFDEGLTNIGACTWPGATNQGACNIGTLSCQGGAPVCSGAVFPSFEVCNNQDDDCNGQVDEIFNKQIDPLNCGACGTTCFTPPKTCINSQNAGATCTQNSDCTGGSNPQCVTNSQPRCTGGTCGIRCNVGFINFDQNNANGCEFFCTPTGNEVCDGVDNDCDGVVDDNIAPPVGLCLSGGECGNTQPMCTGAGGWVCPYQGATEFPEVSCDGLNNDCDANTDESHKPDAGGRQLGATCNDGQNGVCRDFGTYQCPATKICVDSQNAGATCTQNSDCTATAGGPAPKCAFAGPLQCVLTTNNMAGAETCNNQDDDCDGQTDEGTLAGDGRRYLAGQEWIDLGNGRQMMKYEVSRPDATSSLPGIDDAIACSTAGRQPWTNIKYTDAAAECAAIDLDRNGVGDGFGLCTEQDWHRACSVVTGNTYPLAVMTGGTLIEAEDYTTITHATGGTPSATRAWVGDYTSSFSGISAMEATPNTATGAVAIGSPTEAPRMSYTLTLPSASTGWRVYVKLFRTANNGNADAVHVRIPSATGTNIYTVSASVPVIPSGATDTGRECSVTADCTTLRPGTSCEDTNANGIKDTCVGWEWVEAGPFNVGAGAATVDVFMADDGVKIDQLFVRDGTGTPPQTLNPKGNTWAFATNPNTYQPNTCNGDDFDTDNNTPGDQDDILAAGSRTSCFADLDGAGTVRHAFDLSGNVKEWTRARQPGENPIRGGASNNTDVGISCALNFTLADDAFFFPNIGFRCCR